MEQPYVVCTKVMLPDGYETEWCSVLPSLEAAIAFINERANPLHAKAQFELYKLGERVLLKWHDEPVLPADPPETLTVYEVKA